MKSIPKKALVLALLILAPLSSLLGACSDDNAEKPDPANACEFANDGTCDEPANCAPGTDSTDCVAACDSQEDIYLFAAACAHREESTGQLAPSYTNSEPSMGDEPLTGYVDRKTPIASGLEDGGEVLRHYRIEVPEHYNPEQAHPLVINMPGHRVGHRVMTAHTDLTHSADLNDFIVVYAGQEFRQGRWAWWTDWDWETKTDQNPDFAFIRAMIDEVSADYNIDQRRIFLSGHSRGAAMAFIGAVELEEIIAGAVVESGFTEFGYLNERLESWDGRKVPLVFIHGVKDDDVCIDCRPGASCGVNPLRSCAQGMHAADAIVERLESLGWERGENLVYYRLENVAHRWQSQLNQQWWNFLSERPLPRDNRDADSQNGSDQ